MSVSFGRDVGDERRSGSEGGKQGPEEVAERPSQNPTEALRDCVTPKLGTSTRGVERAAGASGCARGTKRVLVPAHFFSVDRASIIWPMRILSLKLPPMPV